MKSNPCRNNPTAVSLKVTADSLTFAAAVVNNAL